MARSDVYKRIIIIFGILALIGSVILGVCTRVSFEDINEELGNVMSWVVFCASCVNSFIFCMFFYLLADILDKLEIVSAQTIRTTKVLENLEENQDEKSEK